jgi:hypothetical protein
LRSRKDIRDRFEARISPEPTSGCWLWTASCFATGYGQIASERGQQPHYAHRLAYELYCGPVGEKHVLHHCDVRECCNPAHLYLGSDKENARDRSVRGRARGPQVKGNDHWSSRLTEAAVRDILRKRMKQTDYAAMYGVTKWAISSVQRRKNWKHVDAA